MSMLKEYRFTVARQNFTHIFDDLQKCIPSLVKARKKNETDGVFLNRMLLAQILEPYKFRVDMRKEEDGSFTAWIEPINDYAMGETEAECRRAAAVAAREFAEDFIHHPLMFEAKNTQSLIPYALRILLCESLDDIEHLLFGEDVAEI
ncbi:hypothetical protein [Anoxybacillus sp. J5B_2022]|uniref:hypothetical protein n=1 Tax=Anoxybacillus sp. J5B_2022 TaxID=3003246 RepID=UPI0022866538|nr:hypothetical protein [Anoxybacillus sp. J5B_2022]